VQRAGLFRSIRFLMAATAVAAGASLAAFHNPPPRFPLPASGDTLFGVQLDHEFDDISGYAGRIGFTPAIYGRYVDFPLSQADQGVIAADVKELSTQKSSLMLTLEPREDLQAVDDGSLQVLTENLIAWNKAGVPVMVRFAHEMNGAWYPWGQQPALYVQKFRQVAAAVHKAPQAAMLWSPNEGSGYPFAGGEHEVQKGSADAAAMDTNHDGQLTEEDDPYAPYWPGDDAVDWVGLSVYHFGQAYPWGENVVPEPGKLADKITGDFKNDLVDDKAVPNFYQEYAEGHQKPFAISETGAFYNPSRSDGASELAIKEAWWNQLFDPGLQQRFPRLKMALWFEFSKEENQPGTPVIDWRTTVSPGIKDSFTKAIPRSFMTAPLH